MLPYALGCFAIWIILEVLFLRSAKNGGGYVSQEKLGLALAWYSLGAVAIVMSLVYYLAAGFFLLVTYYFTPTATVFLSTLAILTVSLLLSNEFAKRMEKIAKINKNEEVVL